MADEKSLVEILDEAEATDEDLVEILVLRNSDSDEKAVSEAADRRVQLAGSLDKAQEQATGEMERAVSEILRTLESSAKRHGLLFDVQEELTVRLKQDQQGEDGGDEPAED